MLFKEIVDARTDARTTDNGPSQKLTLSTLCSGELKMLLFECNITVNSFVSGHRQLRVKSPPPMRTASFGLAYCVPFNNKNNLFWSFHIHKGDKNTVACTDTIIHVNVSFVVLAW